VASRSQAKAASLAIDVTGAYRGSLRLLPTTGPNMLRDVFPQLLETETRGEYGEHYHSLGYVESATIWESSRICVAPHSSPDVLRELIIGIGMVCQRAGLTQIVTVVDARMYRILRMIAPVDIIGTPQRIGEIMCYALLMTHDEGKLEEFQERYNIRPEVVA
jgi:N-acyl-L-homoserine lactone synthetase